MDPFMDKFVTVTPPPPIPTRASTKNVKTVKTVKTVVSRKWSRKQHFSSKLAKMSKLGISALSAGQK